MKPDIWVSPVLYMQQQSGRLSAGDEENENQGHYLGETNEKTAAQHLRQIVAAREILMGTEQQWHNCRINLKDISNQ
jgi:hypothetical protein